MTPTRISLALLCGTLIQPAVFGQMIGAGGTQGFYAPTQIYEPGRYWLGSGQVFLGDIVSDLERFRVPPTYPIPDLDHIGEISYLPESSLPPAELVHKRQRRGDRDTVRILDTGETPEGVLPAGYPSGLMSGAPRKATFIFFEEGRVRLGDVQLFRQ